jgi:hypothetical protein
VTLAKLAEIYGLSLQELFDLEELEDEEQQAEDAPQAEDRVIVGKAPAPADLDLEERGTLYLGNWASFIDELSGDIDEWKYEEVGGVGDPANLSEDDFLRFVQGAAPFIRTYRRVFARVYAEPHGLQSLLQADVGRSQELDREIDRFSRAFRRFSRVMLTVVTDGVAQRVAQLGEAGEAEEPKVSDNVVDDFRETKTHLKVA